MVATTDYVNANPIGLQLGISDYADIGYYLVASNLSDLLGSAALPEGVLLSIMWERDRDKSDFEQLLDGVAQAVAQYGVPVLGGDTKLGKSQAFCATAFGSVEDDSSLALQTRAKPGHDIWLSGPVGSCAAATHGLCSQSGSPAWRQWASERVRRPSLPWAQSRTLSELRIRPGGIDLSDGLGVDLSTLADRSGVGFRVEWAALPVEQQTQEYASLLGVDGRSFATTVGGDLQFLATAPIEVRSSLSACGMVRIGEVTGPAGGRILVKDQSEVPWPDLGHSDARGLSFADEISLLLGWSA